MGEVSITAVTSPDGSTTGAPGTTNPKTTTTGRIPLNIIIQTAAAEAKRGAEAARSAEGDTTTVQNTAKDNQNSSDRVLRPRGHHKDYAD